MLRRLDVLEQRALLPCFDTQDGVKPLRVEGLDVRGMSTQAVCGDKALEVRVVLA